MEWYLVLKAVPSIRGALLNIPKKIHRKLKNDCVSCECPLSVWAMHLAIFRCSNHTSIKHSPFQKMESLRTLRAPPETTSALSMSLLRDTPLPSAFDPPWPTPATTRPAPVSLLGTRPTCAAEERRAARRRSLHLRPHVVAGVAIFCVK